MAKWPQFFSNRSKIMKILKFQQKRDQNIWKNKFHEHVKCVTKMNNLYYIFHIFTKLNFQFFVILLFFPLDFMISCRFGEEFWCFWEKLNFDRCCFFFANLQHRWVRWPPCCRRPKVLAEKYYKNIFFLPKNAKIEHGGRILTNLDAKSRFSNFDFANFDAFLIFSKVTFLRFHDFCKFMN